MVANVLALVGGGSGPAQPWAVAVIIAGAALIIAVWVVRLRRRK